MKKQADLLVVGGGSGGLAAAIRAATHGAKAVLFEPRELGGTCVNRGCVPKKAMWYAAELAQAQAMAKAVGFDGTPGALDWPSFVEHREAYIARSRASYARRLKELRIEVVPELATFVDARTLRAGDADWSAPHILIATGSRPRPLPIAGADLTIDSDGFFKLKAMPRRVALIGGGYIAVELAGVLHALGAQVEITTRSGLLSRFDADLGSELDAHMRAQGINHHAHCAPHGIVRDANGLWLDCSATQRLGPFDCVIAAVGRIPNSENLGLEKAGIKVNQHREIVTDQFENTSTNGVYAIGDVNGKIALTPVAIAAGRQLAERLFNGQTDAHLDYDGVPSVVFSHPPIGSVGLSEAQARKSHGAEMKAVTARFTPMLWSLAGREGTMFLKLVIAGRHQRVVGVHGIGPGMDEMLQGFAVALRMGATYADFLRTVAIHPTAAEEIVTM